MSRTIETTVYQFDELSDRAKDKAREWYRQFVFSDSNDWEFVYEDAAECASMLGIDLRAKPVKTMGGKTRLEPAIYFSGFSSQGDGACFEGSWRWKADAAQAIRDHAPRDEELHRIADELAAIPHGAAYSASIKHTGRYSHSYSMDVSVYGDDDAYREALGNPEDVDGVPQEEFSEAEETITQAMRDFADWIYRQLEAAYEYQASDEAIDETIKANEYEFTEDGNRA